MYSRGPALALLALTALAAWPAAAAPKRPPQLAGYYDAWLVSVDAMIGGDERRTFLGLATDAERELFIRRFWDGRAEALERWHRRFEEARVRFVSLASDRAQALMIAGSPARVLRFGGCDGPVRQLDVWSYSAPQARYLTGTNGDRTASFGFDLVFVGTSGRRVGSLRQWSPADGYRALMSRTTGRPEPSLDDVMRAAVLRPCVPATMGEIRAVRAALREAWSAEELRRRLAPPPPAPGWLAAFDAERRSRLERFPASLELDPIGHFNQYVVVRGRLRVPVSEIGRNAEGLLFDRLVIVGDVWQEGRLAQPFRVAHHVAGPAPAGADVSLDFYRRLRPGTYRLSLRLEDGHGLALLREERDLRVPWVDEEAAEPAGYRQGFAGLLRPEVGVLTTFPSVQLLTSGDELMAGEVEIEAVTTGGPIARLDFRLNGAAAGSDDEPPWAVTLELGGSPEPQVLEALAFDPAGRRIAYDRAELNVGSPRFAVRLLEPRPEHPSDRVRAAVDVPLDETLDRLELFLDDERFAVIREPPFERPLPAGIAGRVTYLRAMAYLAGGETAEDTVILDPRPFEEIDVRLVELYVSVADAQGRPLAGLTAADFRVFEDGEEQTLERFDTVENLPINVALLMDVSQSMRDRLAIATVSAERFFEQVVTPKDRASFFTFNQDVLLRVPFTADVDRLRHGASGLKARGSTRLNDAVIYAVHYFGGVAGKKALVVLSDGHDVDSDFPFEQVLEHTLRSGVAVYAIGLALERLAAATGGRFFAIASATELDRVYRQIEQDLRSQYLLVYRPPRRPHAAFRRVEVEVRRQGVKARTIHGYYP